MASGRQHALFPAISGLHHGFAFRRAAAAYLPGADCRSGCAASCHEPCLLGVLATCYPLWLHEVWL